MKKALIHLVCVVCIFGCTANGQEFQVFFGNLHSHTSFSDGLGTPEDAYQHARDIALLDFLAITEHNHARAAGSDRLSIATRNELYTGVEFNGDAFPAGLIPVANQMTQDGVFVALYGQEVSSISKGNHVNIFDVPAVISTASVPNGDFKKLIDVWMPNNLDSTNQIAILQLNHPGNGPAKRQYGRDDFGSESNWISKLDAHAQLIAIINGPSHKDGGPIPPSPDRESQYLKFLNLGFHLAPVADQDNHFRTWGTITNARTAIVAPVLTKNDILEGMRSRHVYATEDKNLEIIFTVNGSLCGDRVPAPAIGTTLVIEFTIHDPDEPDASYEIDVFADTIGGTEVARVGIVYTAEGNTEPDEVFEIDEVIYEGGHQYFFFRVNQYAENGTADRVWTAPIWFEPIGSEPDPPVASDTPPRVLNEVSLVAVRGSAEYHISLRCSVLKSSRETEWVYGEKARIGHRLHMGCPHD